MEEENQGQEKKAENMEKQAEKKAEIEAHKEAQAEKKEERKKKKFKYKGGYGDAVPVRTAKGFKKVKKDEPFECYEDELPSDRFEEV